MSVVMVGTNHKFCPIQIREKLYFSKAEIKDALLSLKEFVNGLVILSTCNRIELYASVKDSEIGISRLKSLILSNSSQLAFDINKYLYTYQDKEAIFHLFKIACGIDSQIIGETQIAEQVNSAFQKSRKFGLTDGFLEDIFEKALEISHKVRSETEISKGEISLASILMEVIRLRFGSIKNKNILIIGVGKISELVIKYLKEEEIKAVFICNRTYEKAQELARNIDAEVVRFDGLKDKLKEADIVISATASPHLILKREDFTDFEKQRLIIDLAIPRDVDPQVRYLKGITLFCLDDLDFIIEKNLTKRKRALPKVLEIIKEEVSDLCLRENLRLELEPVTLP